MNISPTTPRFGAISLVIKADADEDRAVFDELKNAFPKNTDVSTVKSRATSASTIKISGPSAAQEGFIAKMLEAAGLKIDVTPFQLTAKQERIQAGLDAYSTEEKVHKALEQKVYDDQYGLTDIDD